MMRSLLDNLATLLVAFLLAVVIWMVAVRTEDPLETRTYEVPVTTANLPAGSLLLSNSQTTVQVEVEGPTSVLDEISAADFAAVVDLSSVPTGESAVAIQVQFLREDIDQDQLTIARPFPTQTTTNIDRLLTASVPIFLNINGTVARGFERGAPFLDPEVIEVTGPSTRVNNLAEARVTVLLENQREDVVVVRRPIFYDQIGNVASTVGLTVAAEQVQISVPVSQLAGFANKPITVNWTGAPAAGYNLLDVNVTPDNILVTGLPEQLESLRLLETELIDISGLTESFTQQVSLDLVDGIREDEVQPIFVEFIIEPRLDTAEIDTVPEIRGLSDRADRHPGRRRSHGGALWSGSRSGHAGRRRRARDPGLVRTYPGELQCNPDSRCVRIRDRGALDYPGANSARHYRRADDYRVANRQPGNGRHFVQNRYPAADAAPARACRGWVVCHEPALARAAPGAARAAPGAPLVGAGDRPETPLSS